MCRDYFYLSFFWGGGVNKCLEHPHQYMDNLAKYKKHLFLHILTQKCSTSVFLKLCKNVYISTRATVTVEIYTATVARPFIILFISRSLHFFSLFSVLNKLNNFFSPHLLLFPQMHTNTPTQKNQHRDTLAQKNKNKIEIHKQTQTHKQQRDRSVLIGTIGI